MTSELKVLLLRKEMNKKIPQLYITREPTKVLLIDIETAPSVGLYFDLWKEGNIAKTLQLGYILSFAYKWLDEGDVRVVGLPMYQGYYNNMADDKSLCKDLAELLAQADIVVAHNGDKFDLPKINARLVKHGFKPPEPYKTVDTYKVAKKYFSFESNRLNDLGQFLNLGKKAQTGGIELWKGCMDGDKSAWAKMLAYNAQDVVLLELVYKRLRPWMTGHPNVNVLKYHNGCPVCGCKKLEKRGLSITGTGVRQRYRCKSSSCGAWSQGPTDKTVTIR